MTCPPRPVELTRTEGMLSCFVLIVSCVVLTGANTHNDAQRWYPDKLMWQDHTYYRGERNSDGLPHGFGRMEWKDGGIYEGFLDNGTPNGEGHFRISTDVGRVLTGFWADGTLVDFNELIQVDRSTSTPTAGIDQQSQSKEATIFDPTVLNINQFTIESKDGQHLLNSSVLCDNKYFMHSTEHVRMNEARFNGILLVHTDQPRRLWETGSSLLSGQKWNATKRLRYAAVPKSSAIKTGADLARYHPIAEYTGAINANLQWHGFGSVKVIDQKLHRWTVLRGFFDACMLNGHGVMEWNDGSRYEGSWHNGLRHGEGNLLYSSADTKGRVRYIGEWDKNLRSGTGLQVWKDGSEYDGSWKNDNRNGYGSYTWKDGRKFVGHWNNGSRDGLGMIMLPNGDFSYDVYKNNRPRSLIQRYCSDGSMIQMKELLMLLNSVPMHHRSQEIERCERLATGYFWSNHNVLHALRGHLFKDEL